MPYRIGCDNRGRLAFATSTLNIRNETLVKNFEKTSIIIYGGGGGGGGGGTEEKKVG
jgi:hypothetical protein